MGHSTVEPVSVWVWSQSLRQLSMGQSSSKSLTVGGFVAPGYESVREMFERNFSRGADETSQLCVYVGEEVVVDLWASTSLSSYTGDTLTNVSAAPRASPPSPWLPW